MCTTASCVWDDGVHAQGMLGYGHVGWRDPPTRVRAWITVDMTEGSVHDQCARMGGVDTQRSVD